MEGARLRDKSIEQILIREHESRSPRYGLQLHLMQAQGMPLCFGICAFATVPQMYRGEKKKHS